MKLLCLSPILFVCFLACPGSQREMISTGVETVKLDAGKFKFIGTGRAAQATIDAENEATMKTTSCDAAKLLILAELKKNKYPEKKFKMDNTLDYIMNGEYCRMTGVFDPAAKQ